MYRTARVVRMLALWVMVVVGLMFVPLTRNILCLGFIPPAWRDVPTAQLLKVYITTYSGQTAALAPCTEPARAPSQQDRLPPSDPFKDIRARPQDEEAFAKALNWISRSGERKQRYQNFLPVITALEKAQLIVTWQALHQALTENNITHYIVDGTLLGIIRHRGIIPWDDDLDVVVDEVDIDKVQRVLSCVPGYTLRVQPNMHWKFFADHAKTVDVSSHAQIRHPEVLTESQKRDYVLEFEPKQRVVMRFPFVDVFLMTNDGRYTWTMNDYTAVKNLYLLEDVYPLTQAVLEGQLVPVPRHTTFLMKRLFNPSMCVSSDHNHKEGHWVAGSTHIPCEELAEMYTMYHM